MQAATTGHRLPTLKVTMAFVAACGGDEGAWRAYWAQARRLLEEGAPGGRSHSMPPPWSADGARAANRQPVGGWYVESFTALLRLDAQPIDGYFENVIALPRPPRAGERHEYGLRLRIPDGQLMNSHYLHVPRRRSDHFELRIRFGDPLPQSWWCERRRRRSSTEVYGCVYGWSAVA